ncbi:MAG: Asp-tRNA(Asn)/Glu-tRNA(Gln) amidotransferase subunit GatC [Actinobacteria bacterium]|nr:Asp-tRNA(Asn)/Glu-tRNA(Gln) amidotransferase subunit GatC [Actinomycetota bacterium]
MSIISKEDVKHVAKLAELDFSDSEVEKITPQLDKILGHVANISKVDTAAISPTSHTLEIKNVFREDTVRESLSKKDALLNAPEEMNGGFKVPKID